VVGPWVGQSRVRRVFPPSQGEMGRKVGFDRSGLIRSNNFKTLNECTRKKIIVSTIVKTLILGIHKKTRAHGSAQTRANPAQADLAQANLAR
jgi:hypothetical protein